MVWNGCMSLSNDIIDKAGTFFFLKNSSADSGENQGRAAEETTNILPMEKHRVARDAVSCSPWRLRIQRSLPSWSTAATWKKLCDRERKKQREATLQNLHHEQPRKSTVRVRGALLRNKEVRHRGFWKSEGLQKHS